MTTDDERKIRLQAALDTVRRDFEARLKDEIAQLETLLAAGERVAAHALAHKLAGAGKLFGHPEVTEHARRIEQQLASESGPDPDALRDALYGLARMSSQS